MSLHNVTSVFHLILDRTIFSNKVSKSICSVSYPVECIIKLDLQFDWFVLIYLFILNVQMPEFIDTHIEYTLYADKAQVRIGTKIKQKKIEQQIRNKIKLKVIYPLHLMSQPMHHDLDVKALYFY